jgi:parallel beta-helix repeat protein
VNKALSLVGVNRSTTIIDGSGTREVVTVLANNVLISGFTMQNTAQMYSPSLYCGVSLESRINVTIRNNNIVNNFRGIRLEDSSNNSIYGNNIISNKGGIMLSYSSNNHICGNNITNNEGGIELSYSSNYNSVSENNIANNWDGIALTWSSNNDITGNSIINNYFGIMLGWSTNNNIYRNNFVNNTVQVYSTPGYANTWDDDYPSGGNYWSDHVCAGNPSVGSQPYIIDANNIDHYPFQDLNGWLHPSIPGDINRDGIINIFDIVIAALAFGSYPSHPKWNPDVDLNQDGIINIIDLVIIGVNFGKTFPL